MIDAVLTPALVKELDRMHVSEIEATYGPGKLVTMYSQPFGNWTPGDGTPPIVADGPAEGQAIGRCVASRTRLGRELGIGGGTIHPAKCGWCDYPTSRLLQALDHAIFVSLHVATEYVIWESLTRGETYSRSTGKAGEYRNPVWAEFWRGVTPSTEKSAPADLAYWSRHRREATDTAGRSA